MNFFSSHLYLIAELLLRHFVKRTSMLHCDLFCESILEKLKVQSPNKVGVSTFASCLEALDDRISVWFNIDYCSIFCWLCTHTTWSCLYTSEAERAISHKKLCLCSNILITIIYNFPKITISINVKIEDFEKPKLPHFVWY